MLEFLKAIISFLNVNNINYMLSGSIALGAYTLPRATRNFDFIVEIQKKDAEVFAKHFDTGYYCDADSIVYAAENKSMFIL